ncbi:MAG: riboflavin synthase [Desulfovibrionaceae bacterium]|nr:riboflavin synthase [Desulfovibrionaceae bacterium]
MFTGIISTCGTIAERTPLGVDLRLRIHPKTQFANLVRGESIAVNGACLTVEGFSHHDFTAYASEETLRRTTLGSLAIGSLVNLERALAVGDRLGGHLVTGHIDCLATITGIVHHGRSKEITLAYPKEFAKEVCRKGSVTLDGISLTINSCTESTLSVNLIPETQEATGAHLWSLGRRVNLETDILGKYVSRSLALERNDPTNKGITRDFLAQHGYCSF